ncbi:MAG: class I SAM-dependent methyltransferase [Myxococcota bacterium]
MSPSCALCGGEVSQHLFTKGGRAFLRCVACRLVRVDPLPEPEQIAPHYDASYREGTYAAFAEAGGTRGGIASYRLEIVRELSPSGLWLDIGCSSGDFLEAASRVGVEVEGIDVSEEAVRRARARGLRARCIPVEGFEPEAPYDLVTAFDVIEHVRDPRGFVRRLRDWLAPRGHLVLTLPNVSSVYPRLLMRRHWFYYLPHEHLFYFEPRTITRLLREEGFGVQRVSRAYKPMSLAYASRNLRLFNPTLGGIASAAVSLLPRRLAERDWKLYVGEMLVLALRD